jgi:hypothetical protein
MNPKTFHRNIIPATPIAAAGTLTSGVQASTSGRGVRFYVTVAAGATAGGGTDTIFLCAVPPAFVQGVVPLPPPSTNAIPLVGLAAANAFSVAGTYVADFYPGAWLPSTLAAGGALLGAVGVEVPIAWAVRIVLGAGNSATITVDGELLP